jgi:hypothetical protein
MLIAQESTDPDSVESNPGIHQTFKDLALETIDLAQSAEEELESSDLIFKPAKADADKSFNKLKRSVRTEGEKSIRYLVGSYMFNIALVEDMRPCRSCPHSCSPCAERRNAAIRAIKDAPIIKEAK